MHHPLGGSFHIVRNDPRYTVADFVPRAQTKKDDPRTANTESTPRRHQHARDDTNTPATKKDPRTAATEATRPRCQWPVSGLDGACIRLFKGHAVSAPPQATLSEAVLYA